MTEVSVLIMEDVEEMRELMRGILTPAVKRVTVAGNRPELSLELSRRRPDVVLLDEVIPGESLADLLSDVSAKECRVILLTSLTDRVEMALPPGVLGRVLKPLWKAAEQARFLGELQKLCG